MKRYLTALLCLVLLLTGCGEEIHTAVQSTFEEDSHASRGETEESKPEAEETGRSTTLMIYMVGSDLEAKSGAATADLAEMEEAGLPLSRCNLVVFAGGSRKWHNEDVQTNDGVLLELTQEGFASAGSLPGGSMGEAERLSAFLTYGYENYPAEEYALILWDHGNGPLIGYGKDMLYGDDTLTLSEMGQALENSPFGEENKLAWVGFDACLMASAELACVWEKHAAYLVASQEVEPSFGWNYCFLAQLGALGTQELISLIAREYLSSCEAYDAKKGYSGRDVTLAGYDLSHTGALCEALEALFAAALPNVSTAYPAHTEKRVKTRALGRATTGSEYDLVDLGDLAGQLAELYPEEAAELQRVLGQMVTVNETNALGCCGMSLYYPYYNKTYYQKDWAEVYASLGLFPTYVSYLKAYASIWLKNDLLDSIAESKVPVETEPQVFRLSLTDEQVKNLAYAKFLIFEREGENVYTPIFSSGNVTLEGNVLTANFDGQVIYGRDDYGSYFIPVSVEKDTVGDITRYIVPTMVTNRYDSLFEEPKDFVTKSQSLQFHLAANNKTKEIFISALLPRQESTDVSGLAGGKVPEADLSEYTTYGFVQAGHYYMERYENGVVRPWEQWMQNGMLTYNELPISHGLEFVFAPLVDGKYVLLFELEDTQGSRYCSEPLEIQCQGELPEVPQPDPIEVVWDSGDEVVLFDGNDVRLILTTVDYFGEIRYALAVENNRKDSLSIDVGRTKVNGTVYPDGYWSTPGTVKPGEHVVGSSGISFGYAEAYIFQEGLKTLTASFSIHVMETRETILYEQRITIQMPTHIPVEYETEPESYEPELGLLAEEQVLFQDEALRITLLGLGGDAYGGSLRGMLKVENFSDRDRYYDIEGIAFDGIFVPIGSVNCCALARGTVYERLLLLEDQIALRGIRSAKTLRLLIGFKDRIALQGGGGFAEFRWMDIRLAQSGSPAQIVEGTLLLEENGIRVTLMGSKDNSIGGKTWYLGVWNRSGQGVSADVGEAWIDGLPCQKEDGSVYTYDSKVDNNQFAVIEVIFYPKDRNRAFEKVTVCLTWMDMGVEQILFRSDREITLLND